MRILWLAVLLVAVTAPTAAAAPSRVPGIDISRFQGTINWERVADSGKQFAFVQASRGSKNDCAVGPTQCGADPFYKRNYARAKAAGVRVGPYHRVFVDGGRTRSAVLRDANAEADVFIATVGKLTRGDLIPALDMETPFAGMSAANLRLFTRTWLRRVEAGLGHKAIIYTNLSSWRALGNPKTFARTGYPLWVANWNVRSPLMPAGNWAGRGWRVWQHSSTGRVGGIKGNVDLNWLQGGWSGIAIP